MYPIAMPPMQRPIINNLERREGAKGGEGRGGEGRGGEGRGRGGREDNSIQWL